MNIVLRKKNQIIARYLDGRKINKAKEQVFAVKSWLINNRIVSGKSGNLSLLINYKNVQRGYLLHKLE